MDMTYYYGVWDDYIGWRKTGKSESKKTALREIRKIARDIGGDPVWLFNGKPPDNFGYNGRTPKNAIGIASEYPGNRVGYTERTGRLLIGSMNKWWILSDGTLKHQ